VWVDLGLLAAHPAWGTVALPLLARLYVREKDLAGIASQFRPAFRAKLDLAVELMRWARCGLGMLGKPLWVVADGGYAKAAFLKPMRSLAVTVVSRHRKDSALWSVPGPRPRRGRRSRLSRPSRPPESLGHRTILYARRRPPRTPGAACPAL
jgi:hypothetical protein